MKNIRLSLLGATVITASLSFYFFAQTHFTKNKVNPFITQKSFTALMNEFKAIIPEQAKVTASERVAAHLFPRNEVYFDYDPNGKYPLQEYVLIDVLDSLSLKSMFKLRDYLLKSPDYSLEKFISRPSHLFMLFKRGRHKKIMPQITSVTDDRWSKLKNKVKTNNEAFSLKIQLSKRPDEGITGKVMLRLEKKVDYDVELVLSVSNSTQVQHWQSLFGNGLTPAYMVEPGDVFIMNILFPKNFGVPKSANCKINRYNITN